MSKFLHSLKNALLDWAVSSAYFAVWFCALTFYNQEVSHLAEKGFLSYGFAILQAVVLSKFLVTAQMLQPFTEPDKSATSIYWLVIRRTTFSTVIVLLIRYTEAGAQGFLKGHGFIDSMLSFCQGEPLKVLALTFLYWLIVMPYIAYGVLQHLAGEKDVQSYLRDPRNDS
ncbi:hypothetical protein SAMN06295945_0989 [Polynucleobacter meluiroseus]|uniref:Uncharacterized protein n=1 Tax=Polynucleobacter meluiroseus TaxID=1938814 RepID=A0A240E1B2_9BURK|nr:hypothetical protein [Polynucleobacter meluiroseus]SNX28650.1 hypothetical protein SAMN06295945_0989 [Polynucleobacter meluiroseus]